MLKHLLLTALAAAFAVSMGYADQSNRKVTIPVTKTSPTSGRQMFSSYCAPCHGVDGRGHGPAATALKDAAGRFDWIDQEEPWKIPGHPYRFGVAVWRGRSGARIGGDAGMGSHPW